MEPGPGERSLAPAAPGGGGGLFGVTLEAAATAAAAAAAAAESLAMAAADARMTAAAEGPRGAAKLVRGTRNMAVREMEKWDEMSRFSVIVVGAPLK